MRPLGICRAVFFSGTVTERESDCSRFAAARSQIAVSQALAARIARARIAITMVRRRLAPLQAPPIHRIAFAAFSQQAGAFQRRRHAKLQQQAAERHDDDQNMLEQQRLAPAIAEAQQPLVVGVGRHLQQARDDKDSQRQIAQYGEAFAQAGQQPKEGGLLGQARCISGTTRKVMSRMPPIQIAVAAMWRNKLSANAASDNCIPPYPST